MFMRCYFAKEEARKEKGYLFCWATKSDKKWRKKVITYQCWLKTIPKKENKKYYSMESGKSTIMIGEQKVTETLKKYLGEDHLIWTSILYISC